MLAVCIDSRSIIFSDVLCFHLFFHTDFRSVCAVDVTYFPFDYQMCNFTFGSWAYSGVELDFHNKSMFTDMSSYVQNSEWIVHKLPIIRKVTHYSDVPYPTLTLHLLLEVQ